MPYGVTGQTELDRNNPNVTRFRHPVTDIEVLGFREKSARKPNWTIGQATHPTEYYDYWVLKSSSIFIGDTDDLGFDWYSAIKRLSRRYKFRVYQTYKGYRFFVLNKFFSFRVLSSSGGILGKRHIHELFQNLQCDNLYQNQCFLNGRFGARLTPKLGRDEAPITKLLYSDPFEDCLPDIQMAIYAHDGSCLNYNITTEFEHVFRRDEK